ncbi:bifunctional riboflavin kinase/FAD synthetase [Neisseria sp. Ec49-e6-T10]|uniref:bifunctional riboflavin kinase/FAD synthetase n=1 Tax=Neisseria sp. Ec49-e6-T10 TaxID=3140744 RepID=UPI003EBCD943
MQIWLGPKNIPCFEQGCALTIGNFDGVHLGHKHILRRLKDEAITRQLPAVLLTFEPHPKAYFAKKAGHQPPARLSSLRDKLQLLEDTHCLDAVWVLRFNQQLANLSATSFIDKVLLSTLKTRYLLIGDDFKFGAERQGDINLLKQQTQFVTDVTPSILVQSQRASSTYIRDTLTDGQLDNAARTLGHDFFISGKVKHGAKRGRTLGYPTANIHLQKALYPLGGVFVVEVTGSFGKRGGAASLGLNPTVSNTKEQKLEVFIFDLHEDLYGQNITVHFLKKLRDEVKFDSLESLKAQIEQDELEARHYLSTLKREN